MNEKIKGEIKQEIDTLFDCGFSVSNVHRFLKDRYNFDITVQGLGYYKRNNYKPKPVKDMQIFETFKKYGSFVNALEIKVNLVILFMERLEKALTNERKTPFTTRAVDETMMKMNEVVNELYKMYQDYGLIPKATENISIDTNITENTPKGVGRFEKALKALDITERVKMIEKISGEIGANSDRKDKES